MKKTRRKEQEEQVPEPRRQQVPRRHKGDLLPERASSWRGGGQRRGGAGSKVKGEKKSR